MSNFSSGTYPKEPSPTKKIENKLVSVILTGDVMLGRSVMITSLDSKDPVYPFRKVGKFLADSDIVFINLENPIVTDCPRIESGFTFCADPKMIEGLVYAGIDVANLANNHARNFGIKGFNETAELLETIGIRVTGTGDLVTLDKKGVKFGFLGFDFFSKLPNESDFELISKSNKEVDVLIVGVHWGIEYTDKPTGLQRGWAKKMVDEGADVISGHHPHWVQGSEFIDGKPVYYSLGNFVFDQMWSEETKRGLIIKLTFDETEVVKQEKFPTYIRLRGQPEFVTDEQDLEI